MPLKIPGLFRNEEGAQHYRLSNIRSNKHPNVYFWVHIRLISSVEEKLISQSCFHYGFLNLITLNYQSPLWVCSLP